MHQRLTYDREIAEHKQLAHNTGMKMHFCGLHVDDHRQVQEPYPGRHIGHIGYPRLHAQELQLELVSAPDASRFQVNEPFEDIRVQHGAQGQS